MQSGTVWIYVKIPKWNFSVCICEQVLILKSCSESSDTSTRERSKAYPYHSPHPLLSLRTQLIQIEWEYLSDTGCWLKHRSDSTGWNQYNVLGAQCKIFRTIKLESDRTSALHAIECTHFFWNRPATVESRGEYWTLKGIEEYKCDKNLWCREHYEMGNSNQGFNLDGPQDGLM